MTQVLSSPKSYKNWYKGLPSVSVSPCVTDRMYLTMIMAACLVCHSLLSITCLTTLATLIIMLLLTPPSTTPITWPTLSLTGHTMASPTKSLNLSRASTESSRASPGDPPDRDCVSDHSAPCQSLVAGLRSFRASWQVPAVQWRRHVSAPIWDWTNQTRAGHGHRNSPEARTPGPGGTSTPQLLTVIISICFSLDNIWIYFDFLWIVLSLLFRLLAGPGVHPGLPLEPVHLSRAEAVVQR